MKGRNVVRRSVSAIHDAERRATSKGHQVAGSDVATNVILHRASRWHRTLRNGEVLSNPPRTTACYPKTA